MTPGTHEYVKQVADNQIHLYHLSSSFFAVSSFWAYLSYVKKDTRMVILTGFCSNFLPGIAYKKPYQTNQKALVT